MKSKRLRITLIILLAVVLLVLTAVICIRKSRPKYSYEQINLAFGMSNYVAENIPYYDFETIIKSDRLYSTIAYLNIYNSELYEKGKPEKVLTYDEVCDFYSSEYDENGEPKINNLPKKIEDYVDWYYGFGGKYANIFRHWFGGLSKYDYTETHKEYVLAVAMVDLGYYSERKNTKQLSDADIDNPLDFYIGLYAYNKKHPSAMISEDEIKMAFVGGPIEPLVLFADWNFYGLGDPKTFALTDLYGAYSYYVEEHPDAPEIEDMDAAEIQQLIEYMDSRENAN